MIASAGMIRSPNPVPVVRVAAWIAPAFVWSVWALIFLAALTVATVYGNPFPCAEDWTYYIEQLTGAERISGYWLWKQEGEHRFPLSKLVILATLKLAGGDFRAPILFSVLGLGCLAFAMISVARSLRGHTSFLDAFFPLVILHWGISPYLYAHENLYVLPMLVASTLLLIIVYTGRHVTLASGLLAALCLVLLSLCSAPGLIYLPALIAWLSYCSVRCWASLNPRNKWGSLFILAGVLLALLLVCFYFIRFDKSYSGPPVSKWDALKYSLAFLTAGFGRDTSWVWPYSGILMLALLLLSVGALFAALRTHAPTSSRALGILFFLGASATSALAMGWGRGGRETGIFAYDFLAVPTLCCLFFIWELYRPRTIATVAQACLFVCAVAAFAINTRAGIAGVIDRYHSTLAIERDLRARVPPYLLTLRHGFDSTRATQALHLLRKAGIGSFRYMPDDPAFREIALPLVPTEVHEATWEEETAHGTGFASYLTFTLPRPLLVIGIRLAATDSNEGNAILEVAWRKSGTASFPTTPQYSSSWLPRTLYINDVIDQIRIYPDRRRPSELHISELVLLLPAPEQIAAAD